MNGETLFEVATPLGFRVRVTKVQWEQVIFIKHPVMSGQEEVVRVALEAPDEIRESRSDPSVLLFYRLERPGRWLCAVAKRVDNGDGFLITAYSTDVIKEGERRWSK